MDVSVPAVYVLCRKVNETELESVTRILSITPCPVGIAVTVSDRDLLAPLTQELLLAPSDEEAFINAKNLSNEMKLPVLIAGEGSPLTAVYADGRTESLCLTNSQK